jgi:hypothetical protein
MKLGVCTAAATILGGTGLWGCAGADNPTALADLDPQADIEIHADRVETFDEVEVHVRLTEGGRPMRMNSVQLEIEHALGGPGRIVEMEAAGDEFEAHVMFYEDGEHHLHLLGVPERHRLATELAEDEVHVHRQHAVAGPYWIELAMAPAPALENLPADIHLFVFDLHDGGPGDHVEGLDLSAEMHTPFGREFPLQFTELSHGEYVARYAFGASGDYDMHLEVALAHDEAEDDHEEGDEHAEDEHEEGEEHADDDHAEDEHAEGEFHIPVLSPDSRDSTSDPTDAGGGHGH